MAAGLRKRKASSPRAPSRGAHRPTARGGAQVRERSGEKPKPLAAKGTRQSEAPTSSADALLPKKAKKGHLKKKSKPVRQVKLSPELAALLTPRLGDLVQLMCVRGRKFSRLRLAHFVLEKIAVSEATERSILDLPPELLALFLSREVRVLSDDRAPVNDFFELPDGRLLEYVGDHLEAAETVARLLQAQDEARLDHVIQLLTMHGRSWLHMLALEVRDARLVELGLSDLDDVDRLFAQWHTVLLLRKLAASMTARHFPQGARKQIEPSEIPHYLDGLREPERKLAFDRLRFLVACQAVRDANKRVRKLTPKCFERAIRIVLKVLSRGLRRAGADRSMLIGPQIATIFRLGLQPPQATQA